MKTRIGFAIAMLLLGPPTLAHAGKTIGSPPVATALSTACYIRNVGPKPVSLTVQISNEAAAVAPPTFTNCNVPLNPGKTCVVLTGFINGYASCSATTSGSVKTLRATFEARDGNLDVTDAADLR